MGCQRWLPGRIVGEIRLGVRADDADDDLGDDAAADLPQVVTLATDCGLAEDIQPERRFILPVTEGELLTRERSGADAASDGFAGWQAGAHAALQVPSRK